MQPKPPFVWYAATALAVVVIAGLVLGSRARDLSEIWVCTSDPARPFVAAASGGSEIVGVEIADMPVTAFAGRTSVAAPPFLRARIAGSSYQYFLVEGPRDGWSRYVRSEIWHRSHGGERAQAGRKAAENLLTSRRELFDVNEQPMPVEFSTGGTR